jgi:hypothetical protein
MMSTSLTTAVVAANVAVCAAVVAGITYAAHAQRRTSTSSAVAPYVLAAAGVIAWGVVVFLLAHAGAFATTSDATIPYIAFGVAIPIAAGVALLRVPEARRAIERIPLQWLIGVQFYRVLGGAVFLIGYAQDELPGEFALPAGIGDVIIGVTAVGVAYLVAAYGVERMRNVVLGWCALGIADLVVAIGTGFLSSPSILQQLALDEPNSAITRYPFVLIPTFLVPISIVLHVYVIARVRAGTAKANTEAHGARTRVA